MSVIERKNVNGESDLRDPETEGENDRFLDEKDDGTSESSLEEILDILVLEFDGSTDVVLAGFLSHAGGTTSENFGTTSFPKKKDLGDEKTTAKMFESQ